MDDISEIIQIFSDVIGPCELCTDRGDWDARDSDRWFSGQVNHLLDHGCSLLHVGQQSTEDHAGNPAQRTRRCLAYLDLVDKSTHSPAVIRFQRKKGAKSLDSL